MIDRVSVDLRSVNNNNNSFGISVNDCRGPEV